MNAEVRGFTAQLCHRLAQNKPRKMGEKRVRDSDDAESDMEDDTADNYCVKHARGSDESSSEQSGWARGLHELRIPKVRLLLVAFSLFFGFFLGELALFLPFHFAKRAHFFFGGKR